MSQFNRRSHRKSSRNSRNYYAGHKKTELCRDFINQTCERGTECSFAHGVDELKPRILEVGNYKTEKCQMWFDNCHLPSYKRCQYGVRCHFLHDEIEWSSNAHYTILFSETEEMYRIIRKVRVTNDGFRSKNRNKRGGSCDEVRSCSSKWIPEQWLQKYEAQTKLEDTKVNTSSSSIVSVSSTSSSSSSTFSTTSSDVEGEHGSDMDEDEDEDETHSTSSLSDFDQSLAGLEVDINTEVSSIVSSHVPKNAGDILPSVVSSVTQTPTVSLYEGSLLRMTSVSQQQKAQKQLTVEIPEPVMTIRGNGHAYCAPTVVSQQPQPQQQPQLLQQQQPVSISTTTCSTPVVIQQQATQQPIMMNTQPVQIQQSYIATYMPVLFPDGSTQMLPVLSPLTNGSAQSTGSPLHTTTTSPSPINFTSGYSSPPQLPTSVITPQQIMISQQQPQMCSFATPPPQRNTAPVILSTTPSTSPIIQSSPCSVTN